MAVLVEANVTLRGLIQKLNVGEKAPVTFNVYSAKYNSKSKTWVKNKLLFGFIHAKEAQENDYEYLDTQVLERQVQFYNIISITNVEVILKTDTTGPKPNTDDDETTPSDDDN